MARQLKGIAAWGDRLRLLSVLDAEAPQVRRDLEDLLTAKRSELLGGLHLPESLLAENRDVAAGAFPIRRLDWPQGNLTEVAALNLAIASWARRWKLDAPWMLRTAALTLHRWATRGPLLSRSHFEVLPWANYIPNSKREPKAKPLQEHTQLSTRQKHALGIGIETLALRTDVHIIAFVRWQVLGEGAERVAQKWRAEQRLARAPLRSSVLQAVRRVASAFDFTPRPRAKAGRPKRVRK
jgi:hypothetical protein